MRGVAHKDMNSEWRSSAASSKPIRTVCVAAWPSARWSVNPSAASSCTTGAAPAVPRAARSSGLSVRVSSSSASGGDAPPAFGVGGLAAYGLQLLRTMLVHSSWPPHAA